MYVSVASLWEIAIKQSLGKLDIGLTVQELAQKCEEVGISLLSIEARHLDKIKELPQIHSDPFDRLIIAQAVTEGMELVTKDEKIAQYNLKIIWVKPKYHSIIGVVFYC